MKIAVIGGGFTGLSAAYELGKRGHKVTVYEKEKTLGGLAYGFKQHSWDWHLEGGYHHWFTNDEAILSLIKELGLNDKLIVKRPITANYYRGKIYQFDSPMHLLSFPGLSLVNKLRTAALLAFLKVYPDRIGASPFWRPLEGVTAQDFFIAFGGKEAWKILWEPLMVGKFGEFAPKVAASWLWARIKKRTPRLMYIEGGFHTVVEALEKAIKKQGGKIQTGKTLFALPKGFNRILLTIPTPVSKKLIPELPLPEIPHLHAQTLILETKEPILKDTYWLNVTDRSYPFLAVVAHTNFMDQKHYAGHHITYFGNYLPQGHKYLSMTKEELLKEFLPYIQKISNFKFQIVNSFMFIGPFAQPVHELHYSKKIPSMITPIPGVYLANMDFIVPWDRGTNYAVELGHKAARTVLFSTLYGR